MSAVNIVMHGGRAVIFTDGATYDEAGALVTIGPKCHEVAGLRMAVTGRGPSWFPASFARTLRGVIDGIDAMETDGAAIVDRCIEAAQEEGLLGDNPAIDLFVVGWSDRAKAPRCFQFTTLPPEGVARASMVESVLSPALTAESEANVARAVGAKAGLPDYDRFGRAVMEEQRRTPAVLFAAGRSVVGGHILRTDVTRDGVSQRVIHEWPEDQVGERIRVEPRIDPIAHPNVTALPAMNRADRRRLEKAQKRGAA